jgi:hypothetical protein
MKVALSRARHARPVNAQAWGLSLLAALLAGPAIADERRESAVPLLPAYLQECGACHVAYAPRLLPSASWQRQMERLQSHYGSDASLDAPLTRTLSAWLQAHAGTSKRAREQPPEDRITRAAWFEREHDEVPAATWKLPAVKSPAQCSACHTRADQGDFSERDIRLPR